MDFRITPEGTLTTIYSFTGHADGGEPQAGVIQAIGGNLYGTTSSGGNPNGSTVFKITSAGVLTTLHQFSGSEGAGPQAGLIQATDGNFYGTTQVRRGRQRRIR
jgi:uncharacterized repeat protein (TIGR03803 family)